MQAPPLPFFSSVSLENNLQGHLLTGLANMVMLEGQGGATVIQAVLRQRGHGRHVLDNGMVVPVALVKSRRISSSLVRASGLGSGNDKYHSQLEICQVTAREPGCREPHCHYESSGASPCSLFGPSSLASLASLVHLPYTLTTTPSLLIRLTSTSTATRQKAHPKAREAVWPSSCRLLPATLDRRDLFSGLDHRMFLAGS